MIGPAQIKKKAAQRYQTFLQSVITGDDIFPIELPVGAMPKDFLALKDAITALTAQAKAVMGCGYTLELAPRRTRRHGWQSLPTRIAIETEADYLWLIGQKTEVEQFRSDLILIRTEVPALETWLLNNVTNVVQWHRQWPGLLKVCQYFLVHPQPNLYMRELPIQVHTKFVEQNKAPLRSLLEALLPAEKLIPIDGEKRDVFEKRSSLKYRESLIRLRFLDLALQAKYHFPANDISLPLSSFSALNLQPHSCFITENLMNFLTLPPLSNSLALFGSGGAVGALKAVPWLAQCRLFYWGDLDAAGFKILSQMRSHFPDAQSILMDQETFDTFRQFSVKDEKAKVETLSGLTEEEAAMYLYLATHQLRLEQERIHQGYINRHLGQLALG